MPAAGASSSPRSVALIHYSAPPVVGGVEQVLARQATLLAAAGHDVLVIAGRGGAVGPAIRHIELPLLDARHPTISLLQEALRRGRIPAAFGPTVDAIADQLWRALAGIDVAIAHNVCSLPLNLALTAAIHQLVLRQGAPRLIAWHHDLALASEVHRATLHPGEPWDLFRVAWPGVTQVVVSETRRAELASITGLPPGEISVIPNGVDVARLWKLEPRTRELISRTGLLDADPLLLMPSRVTARKNIGLGLRTIAALQAAGHDAGLIVTGPADPHQEAGASHLAELRDLRRSLGLEHRVWFLSDDPAGSPSDEVVHDLYRFADALFLPSRDEGFGLPLLEAAVNRLPIVCTALPVLRELAGETAHYIEPDGDPEQVAAIIVAAVGENPFGRLARRIRSTYDWEAIFREQIVPLLASG